MTDDSQNPQQPADNSDSELSKYDAQFVKAPAYDGDEVPTGRYRVRVKDVTLTRLSDGVFIFRWQLSIVSGPFTDWHFFKYLPIEENTLHKIKWDLIAVGIKLDSLSDLPRHLESLRGRELEIDICKRWDHREIHFIEYSQGKNERAKRG